VLTLDPTAIMASTPIATDATIVSAERGTAGEQAGRAHHAERGEHP
jgi:hypothetical protein